MFKHWKSAAAVSGLAVSLIAGPALAQQAFGDWDANTDAGIDSQEWNTGWGEQGVFSRLDANGDGNLSQDELNAGVGLDETGAVGESEGAASGTFSTRFGASAFSEWDANGDGNLTEEEFNAGVFSGYDADKSGVIEEQEFGAYGEDSGTEGFWTPET